MKKTRFYDCNFTFFDLRGQKNAIFVESRKVRTFMKYKKVTLFMIALCSMRIYFFIIFYDCVFLLSFLIFCCSFCSFCSFFVTKKERAEHRFCSKNRFSCFAKPISRTAVSIVLRAAVNGYRHSDVAPIAEDGALPFFFTKKMLHSRPGSSTTLL